MVVEVAEVAELTGGWNVADYSCYGCGGNGEGGGIDALSRKIAKSFLTLANS